jgi:hypothetical protein
MSLSVMVTVDVATPSATAGVVPVMVEFAATAAPAVKVTVPSTLVTGEVIERFFTSAVLDASVQFEIPLAFVTLQAPYTFVAPVSVAEKVGVTPDTGLLKASMMAMLTVEVALPFASTGPVPVIVDVAATGDPLVNVTVPPIFVNGEVMERVLISAFVDFKIQVESPLTSVELQVP